MLFNHLGNNSLHSSRAVAVLFSPQGNNSPQPGVLVVSFDHEGNNPLPRTARPALKPPGPSRPEGSSVDRSPQNASRSKLRGICKPQNPPVLFDHLGNNPLREKRTPQRRLTLPFGSRCCSTIREQLSVLHFSPQRRLLRLRCSLSCLMRCCSTIREQLSA